MTALHVEQHSTNNRAESNCLQYVPSNLFMSIFCTTRKLNCQLTCVLEHLKLLLLTHPVELTTVQEAVPQLLSSADV